MCCCLHVVTECKFVRPNNTETSESGAEKGLLQHHARSWVAYAPQNPTLPKGVKKHF